MGHRRLQGTKGLLTALALLCLMAFASSAQAAAPSHPRLKALDVSALNHACGVATDTKGDLYASSAGEGKVKVFNAAHTLLTSIPEANEPCGLAVTTTGNLYVSEQATGEVVRFKPNAYPFSGTPSYGSREVIDASGDAKGIAVDRNDNRLYVAEGDHVSVYEASGSFAAANETQKVQVIFATGGTFTLSFEGQTTAPIPFDATAVQVREALEGLSNLAPGDVAVSGGTPVGGNRNYEVTFEGSLAQTDVEKLQANGSGLTGEENTPSAQTEELAKPFSGHLGEGVLDEATGVAIYSYRTSGGGSGNEGVDRYLWVADANGVGPDRLELFGSPTFKETFKTLTWRRELTGASTPDGSFDFGAAGAYLAADPGNREPAGEKCVSVAEQACTAGHLFLYDAGHEALDEFDAAGEYLDQTSNAAFADAGPTQVAIDRSGGANDGTIYVTTGAGAGAKVLAFGPLAAPSRAVLGEPLSHVLAGAAAVATDSHGYLYAVSGTKVHVYDPKGAEVLRKEGEAQVPLLTDAEKPTDLSVDSAGRVYVLDVPSSGERKVTYYTPSSFPPSATTTYSRHVPPVATNASFSEEDPKAIAVNPGPGAGKDRLFVASGNEIHEFDSAANGSTLLNGNFGGAAAHNINNQSLAVDGRNGHVFLAHNGLPFLVFSADGTEVLARINEAGSPAGPGSFNPYLAVDQSNGHVLEFDGSLSTAREYDASGAFVAEFGVFTQGIIRPYRVAIDSACALHEPPLDETTTPTCAQYDPANGTAYVAFDDSNKNHPPYDVNAFGPLSYPAGPVEPKEFKLTVSTTGSGTGEVTSSPAGISCGEDCSEVYAESTKVTLTATPSGGSTFAGWSGACTGTGPCEVTMSEAKAVAAQFSEEAATPKFLLKVKPAGSGTGTVTSSPTGVNCGLDCSEEYDEGTEVTLSGAPGANSKAVAWTGCTSVDGSNKCHVTMSAAKEVTATFDPVQHLLSVSTTGSGTGEVTSSPAGIQCGGDCSQLFDHGTEVTLTPTPDAGSEFTGWSGACSGTGACVVTMSEAKSLAATFAEEPTQPGIPLKVELQGTGTGKVASNPGLISCNPFCEDEFQEGAKVTLTASPDPGSLFMAWKGCDAGAVNGRQCTVTLSKAKTVVATFITAHALTLTKAQGSGPGKVQSAPGGVLCLANCTEAEALFKEGAAVTLKATPAKHFHLASWGGDCSGTGACQITMGEAHEVSADFQEDQRFALELSKSGGGQAQIKTKPAGLLCAYTCAEQSASFYAGEPIAVAWKLAKGTTSLTWAQGAGTCTGKSEAPEGTCTVTLAEAESLEAQLE